VIQQVQIRPKCADLKLTHLCFADDLMVFLGADVQSPGLIQDVLQSFKKLSRLSAKFNGK